MIKVLFIGLAILAIVVEVAAYAAGRPHSLATALWAGSAAIWALMSHG